jgi:hypothetical protein
MTAEQFEKKVESEESRLQREIVKTNSPVRSQESKRVVPPARLIPENQYYKESPPVVITEEMVEAAKPKSNPQSSSSEKVS